MPVHRRFVPVAVLLALAAVLAGGCASSPKDDLLAYSAQLAARPLEMDEVVAVARFSLKRPGDPLPPHWRAYRVPGKPPTEYRLVSAGEQVALEARAERSASGLYRPLRVDPHRHPVLEWRWQVPALIEGADPRTRSREDSPARIIVSFHGDSGRLDLEERARLRLVQALSGQSLPYAMLVYIWSNELPVGTVVPSPRLGRIRIVVAESGSSRLGRWVSVRRNVLEDYRRAFGEEPWDVVAVGVMSDTDDTGSSAHCLYGDISFRRGP